MNILTDTTLDRTRMTRFIVLYIFICIACIRAIAQNTEYSAEDSAKVVRMLSEAKSRRGDTNRMLYFGKQFVGVPYVEHTLENGTSEHLIVNLHEMDCTTFVETVLALSLCDKHDERTFADYCRWLTRVRYRDGKLTDYTNRLHYFTWWGEDNERLGLVKCIEKDAAPFASVQQLKLNYMSTHVSAYKHLKANPKFVEKIRKMEQASNGRTYRYIPKRLMGQSQDSSLGIIHTGDIVAMLTNKPGLDTSHIGIAVWQDGKLHLLNASSLYHKVVIDTNTFYDYMQQQKSQTGVRVFRMQ